MTSTVSSIGIVFPLGVAFSVSFLVSLLFVCTKRWHISVTGDLDPGIQRAHLGEVPRVGGLALVIGLSAAVAAVPTGVENLIVMLLVGSIPALVFGVFEDFTKSVGVRTRLFATLASGWLAWYLTGYSLTRLDIAGIDFLLQAKVVSVILTAVAVAGLANAVNIIDGLNGLAGCHAVVAHMAIAFLAATLGDIELMSFCMLLAACTAGFLALNWPLGKIFLGDGGSYFLGFSTAWACILLVERHSVVSPFAAVLLTAHPLFEVAFTVFRRACRLKGVGRPDRLHMHSLVNRRFVRRHFPRWSVRSRNSTAGLLMGGFTLLPALLFLFNYDDTRNSILLMVIFCFGYCWMYRTMLFRFAK